MKVTKFGGSSLASGQQFKKVVEIIKKDKSRRFIVVSAPGKRFSNDIKVTDLLIEFYKRILQKKNTTDIIEKVLSRYKQIGEYFKVDKKILEKMKEKLVNLGLQYDDNDEYFYDKVLASGEQNNAILLANILKLSGMNARFMSPKKIGIFVTEQPQNAQILSSSYQKIKNWRKTQTILVIPGFFGYTKKGNICTFSRGGSDISGSIISAGLKADIYENFTDVNGIYSVNPTYITNPALISELSYREMRELAYAGFSVFHKEALLPSFKKKIPVVIKNTNNPNHPGTIIKMKRKFSNGNSPVTGIASDIGFSMIYIRKYLMNQEIGFTLRILKILKEFNLNYEHIPSGIDDISIILRTNQFNKKSEKKLIEKINLEVQPDEIKVKHRLAMIVIVGEGMSKMIGINAESILALTQNKIKLEMINHGSIESSIVLGISEKQEKFAIEILYHTFFK